MTTKKLFLIKAEIGRSGEIKECIMRLPVDQYGGITSKGHREIAQRFFDGATSTPGQMKYALCLEVYSNAKDLMGALENYQSNKI